MAVRALAGERRAWRLLTALAAAALASSAQPVAGQEAEPDPTATELEQGRLPEMVEKIGFRAHTFDDSGATRGGAPTGEKPESKLWFHDGSWWGVMVSSENRDLRTIHRLRGAVWRDTGTVASPDVASKEDVLSEAGTLYIASRRPGELRRYTYDAAHDRYAPSAGFPLTLPSAGTSAATLARDSTGTLWLGWEVGRAVHVAHTVGSDVFWGEPFVLPVPEARREGDVDSVAALIAFRDADGPAIGIMWTDEIRDSQFFAVHRDGDPATEWSVEVALFGPNEADDHINLKAAYGRVYAAVKTANDTVGSPLIRLLVRDERGEWQAHTVGDYATGPESRATRPIVAVNLADQAVYVYMTMGEGPNAGGIAYKRAPLGDISFADSWTVFIRGQTEQPIDDATTMKANATARSGMVVLASSRGTYWWNRLGGEAYTPTGKKLPIGLYGLCQDFRGGGQLS